MNTESKAISYLNHDPVLHKDMLEALRHGEADILQAKGRYTAASQPVYWMLHSRD